jgi:hypothetical protein
MNRQLRKFRENGLRGNLKAFRREKKAVKYLKKKIKQRREALAKSLLPGWPGWAGGKLIMREIWRAVIKETGISPTSGKRKETFGNPSSDHFWLNLFSFAKDFATGNNQALAQHIRSYLDPGGIHHDYESFYIVRFGYRFRIQIIAGTHGTGPHLHIGIKREGKA